MNRNYASLKSLTVPFGDWLNRATGKRAHYSKPWAVNRRQLHKAAVKRAFVLLVAGGSGWVSISQAADQPKAVGLGIEPNGTSTVTKGVAAANENFMIEIKQSRNLPKARAVDGMFEYTIDREKFLGEPVVALIKGDPLTQRTDYLIILHYNIPTVKTSLLPVQYGFARLGVRFLGFDQGDSDAKKVDLLSIYPTNELLDVEHTDKGTNTHPIHGRIRWLLSVSERTNRCLQLPTSKSSGNRKQIRRSCVDLLSSEATAIDIGQQNGVCSSLSSKHEDSLETAVFARLTAEATKSAAFSAENATGFSGFYFG